MPRPTVLTGSGSALELCDLIAEMGYRRVTLVTDEVLVKLGLPDPIRARLVERGIDVQVFAGVVPDPPFEVIDAGRDVISAHGSDALLAVGGGSTLDAAKAMAVAVTNTKPLRDMVGTLRIRKAGLPLFVLPTTAGTGSEVTIVSVVSDAQAQQKRIFVDPKLTPVAAALDASLMVGVPPHVTAPTGMDALTHAIEAYISAWAVEDTDRYAIAATKMIFENLKRAYDDGSDVAARGALAMAAHFAGIAFGQAGVGYVHAISHQFGARYHVPHGLGNAIVLPYVLRFSEDAARSRLATLGRLVEVASDADDDEKASLAFIDAVQALNDSLDIPRGVAQIREEDIPEMAYNALTEAHVTYGVPKYLSREACEGLIRQIGAAATDG